MAAPRYTLTPARDAEHTGNDPLEPPNLFRGEVLTKRQNDLTSKSLSFRLVPEMLANSSAGVRVTDRAADVVDDECAGRGMSVAEHVDHNWPVTIRSDLTYQGLRMVEQFARDDAEVVVATSRKPYHRSAAPSSHCSTASRLSSSWLLPYTFGQFSSGNSSSLNA